MRIVLLQLSKYHNPDYPSMAAGLRALGHEVYYGRLDSEEVVVWDDDSPDVLERISVNGTSVEAIDGSDQGLWGRFHKQMSLALGAIGADVVQYNHHMLKNAWKLRRKLGRRTLFIQDVKQINLGVRKGLRATLRDRKALQDIAINARFISDHTLFDYHYAAEAALGRDWSKRATVVPVGLNPELLTLPRPTTPFAGMRDPVRFVYVGSINRFRQLEILLEGARIALQHSDCFQMDLIGPDRSGGYFQKVIDDGGMQNIVRLLPAIEYTAIPAKLNAGYDVGLAFNPIRPTWDFQPTIKLLEYVALGMPIISSDVRAHRDFVEPGRNGLLVPNTPEAWANAIRQFVQDREFLADSYSQAVLLRRGNTIADVAQMHEAVYRELLAKNGLF